MLVLSRRIGESIVIDGDITITVVDVGRGGQVRIGIDAPRQRRVYRRELLDEVGAANAAALAADPGALARAQDLLGATQPITEERR